jgi:arginyl-tRNA--protein-N-Asp/Glu arginylyltransferase
MDDPSPEGFMDFLTAPWAETLFYEFRLGDLLVAIAVVDRLEHALSAVYTFYDPACRERSLGRYAILHEIEEARAQGLAWLYLGYWIAGCRKMRYKNEYQPLEYYVGGRWDRARTVSAGG